MSSGESVVNWVVNDARMMYSVWGEEMKNKSLNVKMRL